MGSDPLGPDMLIHTDMSTSRCSVSLAPMIDNYRAV